MDIKEARKQIDSIDSVLVTEFEKRLTLIKEIVNIRMNITYHLLMKNGMKVSLLYILKIVKIKF